MNFPKRNKSNRVMLDQAEFVLNSGVIVNSDYRFPTVEIVDCISSVFLQGNDAEVFYSEVKAICKRFPSIAEDIAELIVAYDYLGVMIESIEE